MNDNTILVIAVIAFLVVYWGGSALYKRKLANDISTAMIEGRQEDYVKLLFSKRAMYFLEPSSLCLLRASYKSSMGEMEEAEKNLKVVRTKKLNFEQKVNYYQVRTMVAMHKKDEEGFKAIKTELEALLDEKNAEIVKAMIKENDINYRLYFKFDASVIKDLNDNIKAAEGPAQGVLRMSLAKAYHLNGQDKEAMDTLNKAKNQLKGTFYEDLIDATMNDLSIMDNEN